VTAERGLKDEAVPDFVKSFMATMALAKISDQALIQDTEDEKAAPVEDIPAASPTRVEAPVSQSASSVSITSPPLRPWPAGVEMRGAKNEYNLAMYNSSEGSRIRIAADLDLKGAKLLAKLLESRIKTMEDEYELLSATKLD
jgi:hypothetical protein